MQFNLYICWRLDLLTGCGLVFLILRGKLRGEVKMTSYDFRWMANYTVIREKDESS
jgi:hypothetical protein